MILSRQQQTQTTNNVIQIADVNATCPIERNAKQFGSIKPNVTVTHVGSVVAVITPDGNAVVMDTRAGKINANITEEHGVPVIATLLLHGVVSMLAGEPDIAVVGLISERVATIILIGNAIVVQSPVSTTTAEMYPKRTHHAAMSHNATLVARKSQHTVECVIKYPMYIVPIAVAQNAKGQVEPSL